MLVRVAYYIVTYGILPFFLLNMDETPLMLLARRGFTWGEKGASNIGGSGAKDKRQNTFTPWLTSEGILAFAHSTLKGKTDGCLPSAEFRREARFQGGGADGGVKLLFDKSENHWVTKTTM
jgi:hypothetical protein